jgi:meso-butanediol dehydrogenase / (S,S)-butanediol dehydrogenase / diacetyl reductase
MNLKGKTALITGGGTGIGAAIAKRFVADGAKVCITGRRQELLDKVAQSLPADRVATCSGDVSKYEDIQRMVDATLKFGDRLDVLVNNAGIDPGGTVTDLDLEIWRKVMDINLTGSFLAMKVSIPHMIKGGGRFHHQYFLIGRTALPAGHGGLLYRKSRAQHAHAAGRSGLRSIQSSL